MKRRFLSIFVCGLVCAAAMPGHAAQPWLSAVGDRTVVCCNPSAEPAVRQAAEKVLAELRQFRADAVLLDPDKLAIDYSTLGTNHVICVGQWADNQVLRMTWGYWATSKARREWAAKGDALAKELLDLWDKDIPAQEWRGAHEFFAFGYGQFDGPDVGYVQTVRNPCPILLRSLPGQKQYDAARTRVNDRYPYNQMYFMIHLTGTGPAGVARAVDAFLNQGLLNGVLPGATKPLLDEWNLEGLGPKQLATDLPVWAPTTGLPEGVHYLGQQMAGSHLYGGFGEASGQRPLRCWRLKYAVPGWFVLYDSYPTNRASGNELFIAEMADAKAAGAAANTLRDTMGSDETQETATWTFGGHNYALYAGNVNNRRSWADAKIFCEQRGGHLITLGSKAEENALVHAMAEAKGKMEGQSVWIGMSGDWRTNTWAWVTGEPITYRGWPTANGKETFSNDVKTDLDELPAGKHPVLFHVQVKPGQVSKPKPSTAWTLASAERQNDALFFACEWDGPRPPAKRAQHIAVRDRFVVMQSFTFDDPAGDTLLHKAMDK